MGARVYHEYFQYYGQGFSEYDSRLGVVVMHGGLAGALAGLVASIGVAFVITSAASPGRLTPQIIDNSFSGLSQLGESSLGQKPTITYAG